MNGIPLNLGAPPSDLPKMDEITAMMDRLGRSKTGWALQVGLDAQKQPILLFRDEIMPPNSLKRFATWLLTGMKWTRTS